MSNLRKIIYLRGFACFVALIKQIDILVFLDNKFSSSFSSPIRLFILLSGSLRRFEMSKFNALIRMMDFALTMALLISTLASIRVMLLILFFN